MLLPIPIVAAPDKFILLAVGRDTRNVHAVIIIVFLILLKPQLEELAYLIRRDSGQELAHTLVGKNFLIGRDDLS